MFYRNDVNFYSQLCKSPSIVDTKFDPEPIGLVMLVSAKALKGYKLKAKDGELGKVKDFYFDDKFWTTRYIIVDTGNWLRSWQVLISPYFINNVDHVSGQILVDLTKAEIAGSPPLESDKPVSRQYERTYYSYYGAPLYWGGPFIWGHTGYLAHNRLEWEKFIHVEKEGWDPNLRSYGEVTGYNIKAMDGGIGTVSDFAIDDEIWSVRYMIVDTGNWMPGKKVLVSPEWIDQVNWEEAKVYVRLSQKGIRNAPEYDPDEIFISGEYESELLRYYEEVMSHE
jgi:hypothetical protein